MNWHAAGAAILNDKETAGSLRLFLGSGQFALFNRHMTLDHAPGRVVGWGKRHGWSGLAKFGSQEEAQSPKR